MIPHCFLCFNASSSDFIPALLFTFQKNLPFLGTTHTITTNIGKNIIPRESTKIQAQNQDIETQFPKQTCLITKVKVTTTTRAMKIQVGSLTLKEINKVSSKLFQKCSSYI